MPDDPKWRVIARRARRPISEVVAVFTRMMVNANSANADGKLRNWNDEVVAAALDNEFFPVTAADVAGVREAMRGVVLEGDALMGWTARQPKREDYTSSARSVAFRERQRAKEAALLIGKTVEANPANPYPKSGETTPALPATVVEVIAPPKKPRGGKGKTTKDRTRIAADAQPTDSDRKSAAEAGLGNVEFRTEWARFRDWHLAQGSLMADWSAAWRTWLTKRGDFAPRGASAANGHESNFTKAARTLLGEIEDATATAGEASAIASTLPDAAFRTPDDPFFPGEAGAGDARPILDLEPFCPVDRATADAV